MTKHDGNEQYKTVVIGDYVFTPIKNQFNDKTAYWLSKKGYTIAVYCFTVSNRDDFCMLENNKTLVSYIDYFDKKVIFA